MKNSVKNVLWTILACALLFAFALAIPSGMLTTQAQMDYLDEAPADVDDEYAFLFE